MWMEEVTGKNGEIAYKYIERYKDDYTEKWKRVTVTLDSSSNRAKKKAQRILDGKIEERKKAKGVSDMTFGELYEEWFNYYKKIVKRTSWIKVPKMMPHIRNVISDDTLIKNIDENLVQKIIDNMYTFGTLSLNYTKQTKTTLSTMLRYAVDRKYIKRNVALDVQVIPKNDDKQKKKQRMEEKYLEPNEIEQLIKYLYSRKQNYLHGLISEFLYLNGLRYGELQAIQVKNYKDDYVEIHGTLDYTDTKMEDAKKTTPKNDGSWRNVKMTERSKEILDILLINNTLNHGRQNEDSYLFVSYAGTPLTIGSYNQVLKNAAEKLGIKKNLTSHIFRHTHIATLSELGIPLEAIMERVGHMDASTTLGIYNHVTSKMKEQLIQRLNKLPSFAPSMPLLEEDKQK